MTQTMQKLASDCFGMLVHLPLPVARRPFGGDLVFTTRASLQASRDGYLAANGITAIRRGDEALPRPPKCQHD